MASPRAVVAAALLSTLALAACTKPATRALPPDEARKLLIDRNWLDKLPARVEDKLKVYRFVPTMGGGVFQDRTLFFGTFELFQFEATGSEIRFDLLHTRDKRVSKYTIEQLATPGPDGVDLRLTIVADPRGPKSYYGWRNEGKDLDAHLAALGHALQR